MDRNYFNQDPTLADYQAALARLNRELDGAIFFRQENIGSNRQRLNLRFEAAMALGAIAQGGIA